MQMPSLKTLILALPLAATLSIPAHAQDSSDVSSVIEACTPLEATGASIGGDLTAAGWVAQPPEVNLTDLRNLIGSQMWMLEPDAPLEEQLALVDDYTTAFANVLEDPEQAQMYTKTGNVAVILAIDEDLSCLWAGPEDAAFTAQVETIDGFADVDEAEADTTFQTAATNQTITTDGREWMRNQNYARLPEAFREGPHAAAARLDRSPIQ